MPTSLEMDNQTEISNSTFGFCFFLRHSKNTSLLYSQTHQILSCTQIWLILFTITIRHFTKNRMQSLPYTMQRCIRIYRTMGVRESTIFHERSQWSCSQHSLTKTENFAVLLCYAPLRAPSPSTYKKKMILPPLRRRG